MFIKKLSIFIYGTSFSPKSAIKELEVNFESFQEAGEIGNRGRFKGIITPFGHAVIKPPENIKNDLALRWLLDYLEERIKILRKLGGDDIVLDIEYSFEGLFSDELKLHDLQRINAMKISYSLSAWHDGNDL